MHQEFNGIHLGTFVGLSNPHISKITNFIFSQNSPPSHLCCGAPPTLAMCKTLRIQNFRAPRFSWYSFGDICRPFQPSHLKNHEFHFFTKLPTKPSSYAMVHPPTWPSVNSIQFKTFVHQDFYGTHLETFVVLSNPHISKTTNFIFSQNSPTSNLANGVVHRQLLPCGNPSEPKTFVHQEFHGIHLGTFVGLSNPRISKITNFIFSQNSSPSHLPMLWCTANDLNSKLSCTKIFMVFICGYL